MVPAGCDDCGVLRKFLHPDVFTDLGGQLHQVIMELVFIWLASVHCFHPVCYWLQHSSPNLFLLLGRNICGGIEEEELRLDLGLEGRVDYVFGGARHLIR